MLTLIAVNALLVKLQKEMKNILKWVFLDYTLELFLTQNKVFIYAQVKYKTYVIGKEMQLVLTEFIKNTIIG